MALVLAVTTLPAHAMEPARVPQRAIDLFERADKAYVQKDYRQALALAEEALGYTDIIEHRDQRGTLVQMILRAGFKDGHPSTLCHLDDVLELYAVEVSQTFDNSQSLQRVLRAIGDARTRLRAKLPANGRSVGCTDRDQIKLPGLTVKTREPVCEPVEHPVPPASVEPSPSHEEPNPRESVARQPIPNRTPVLVDDTTPKGLQAVLAGSAFVGLSGALMISTGVTLGLYDASNQANETIYDVAVAEDRLVTATEEATIDDNFANAATYRKLAIGMGASAGVLLAIGLPVLAVGIHRRRKAQKNVAVQPVFGPTQAGLSVRGRF
ncbi:MAG: hypothetical protein ACPG4T_06555 [Nannocystaceae bacterium]